MSKKIQVKGIRNGLLVTLGDTEWQDAKSDLLAHLTEKSEFLKGASLTLDVGNQVIKATELGKLREILADLQISLKTVLSHSPKTELSAQALGLGTRISQPHPNRIARRLDTTLQGEEGLFMHRTLRSGFKLEFPGHVTILGDVNPGAEIISGGCVIIWGRLLGTVHAGAEGDESAYVCALDLSPTQLRLAGKIAISPKRRGKPKPETAFLRKGQVVAESWNPKGK